MRSSFIIIAFAFIALFVSTNLVAQNGRTSVSIGSGQFANPTLSATSTSSFFVTSTTKQTSQFTPTLTLKLERRVLKNSSIGLIYSSLSVKSERTINSGALRLLFLLPATTTHQTVDAKISGLTLNLKRFLYSDASFQAYAGASVGVLSSKEKITETEPNPRNLSEQVKSQSVQNNVAILAEINVGARYFVTENVGVYGEIGRTSVYGLGGMSGQAGVICRF
jgi:hypothetical protein